MARARALVFALLLAALPARAGVPAGGLDIFADHYQTELERAYRHRPGYRGAFGDGPYRLSLYGLSIGGIRNNTGTATTPAVVFASERHLTGKYMAGGSFGVGESDTLKWSHGEVHAGMLASEGMALRIGYTSDSYDYLSNKVDDPNVSRDVLRGVCVGADVFGSPAPGWFIQASGDLLPLKTELTDGSQKTDLGFTVRGALLFGFSLRQNFDVTLMGMAVPRLGDRKSNAGHFGGGLSLTF